MKRFHETDILSALKQVEDINNEQTDAKSIVVAITPFEDDLQILLTTADGMNYEYEIVIFSLQILDPNYYSQLSKGRGQKLLVVNPVSAQYYPGLKQEFCKNQIKCPYAIYYYLGASLLVTAYKKIPENKIDHKKWWMINLLKKVVFSYFRG